MSLNSLKPSLVKGFMNETGSTVMRSARVDTESTAGTAVKLSTYNGGIVVTPVTATTDKIYGFIPFTPKKDTFAVNDEVRVVIDNAIVVMEASAAISLGAELEIVPTGMKVATKNTGSLVGTALQAATTAGDLIKVEIKK